MRFLSLSLVCIGIAGLAAAAAAGRFEPETAAFPESANVSFTVMRNGDRIGTSTLRLRRRGDDIVADLATHVAVKIASFTVYRFDQTETEHWSDGQLIAVDAVTDDNGTIHRVSAQRRGSSLAVNADGRLAEVDPTIVTASLWNVSLTRKTQALNLQDGTLTPVSVTDHGQEQLVVGGRPTTTHHYSIRTNFPQDVWYDQNHQLVKVEMRGIDGSTIRYQPG